MLMTARPMAAAEAPSRPLSSTTKAMITPEIVSRPTLNTAHGRRHLSIVRILARRPSASSVNALQPVSARYVPLPKSNPTNNASPGASHPPETAPVPSRPPSSKAAKSQSRADGQAKTRFIVETFPEH